MSSREPLLEPTFVARLGVYTALRANRKAEAGETTLIAKGEVEERQLDATGRYGRCDIRLNSHSGRKLVSGEVKRPEDTKGRDPRNESLVRDARLKAVARGLPFYFTCNMVEVVLFEVSEDASEHDREIGAFPLAPIRHSSEVDSFEARIDDGWIKFLDDLEPRLAALSARRPSVTNEDVLTLRDAIRAIADEAIDRVARRVEGNPALTDEVRDEAARTFGFPAVLKSSQRARFREELYQILQFGIFVIVQKLVLYRVLEESGPQRTVPFRLDPLVFASTSTDPQHVRVVINQAVAHAIERSLDYETAFLPRPLEDLVFTSPKLSKEVADCRAGEVWNELGNAVAAASWQSISQNLNRFSVRDHRRSPPPP